MNVFWQKPLRNWFFLALLVQVVTAWFSIGFFHPDEHYQVLEFCNYKLGLSPASDLPWEFGAKCRSAFQPFVAYLVSRLFLSVNCYDPWNVAFVLRLTTGLLSWWSICRMVVLLLSQFRSKAGQQFFLAAALFTWYVPFLGVRFSAENISASFFLLALSVILKTEDGVPMPQRLKLLLAGFLLGCISFIRLQFAFGFVGLAVWVLFVRKMPAILWLLLVAGAVLGIGANVAIDHWFYGEWLLTPYNYFDTNIIKNIAANYGVSPWWYYLDAYFEMGIPPISLVLMLFYLAAVRRQYLNIFVLVSVPFLLGHFAIGHKELRFLFPMAFPVAYLASICVDSWAVNRALKSWILKTAKVVAFVNVALLCYKMFTPADDRMLCYRFLSRYVKGHSSVVVGFKQSPYRTEIVEQNFYKPQKNQEIMVLKDSSELTALLNSEKNRDILYLSHNMKAGEQLAGFKTQRLYCFFPQWLLQYNFNDWQSRTDIWSVHKIGQ